MRILLTAYSLVGRLGESVGEQASGCGILSVSEIKLICHHEKKKMRLFCSRKSSPRSCSESLDYGYEDCRFEIESGRFIFLWICQPLAHSMIFSCMFIFPLIIAEKELKVVTIVLCSRSQRPNCPFHCVETAAVALNCRCVELTRKCQVSFSEVSVVNTRRMKSACGMFQQYFL
jgi:hypothetical protein